jgi:uncharacterized protein YecT (DUF1311 family)
MLVNNAVKNSAPSPQKPAVSPKTSELQTSETTPPTLLGEQKTFTGPVDAPKKPLEKVSFGLDQTAPEVGAQAADFDTVAEYRKADAELNRVYKEIRSKYSHQPEFLNRLETAQIQWIKLRDADLEALYPDNREYGSVQRTCVSLELTKVTEARTEYLRRWLEPFTEGDLCAGSTTH